MNLYSIKQYQALVSFPNTRTHFLPYYISGFLRKPIKVTYLFYKNIIGTSKILLCCFSKLQPDKDYIFPLSWTYWIIFSCLSLKYSLYVDFTLQSADWPCHIRRDKRFCSKEIEEKVWKIHCISFYLKIVLNIDHFLQNSRIQPKIINYLGISSRIGSAFCRLLTISGKSLKSVFFDP